MNLTVPKLTITIPQNDETCIDTLIKQLRYLETPACRAKMGAAEISELRAEVTKQFRNALMMKDFFSRASTEVDELYN